MKNYVKGFNEMFKVNEMASTLSKLGLPKRLVGVIHKLPDTIEKIKPFTYNQGSRSRQAELEPISQNRPSHEVRVVDHFRMRKTELLGNQNSSKTKPGFLANMEQFPLAKDMRIILAVPEPGGKYAGVAPRFDYIYHKGTAWGKRDDGGGKKYRVLTMDADGNIVRDWAAYQNELTYPKNPMEPNAPIKKRNDFKDFPTAADKKIDVYILDLEEVGTEFTSRDMGKGITKTEPVPIGKARQLARDRKKAASYSIEIVDNGERKMLYGGNAFIYEFAKRFEGILTNLFGKRKEKAREKYRELVADGTDISTDQMRNLQRLLQDNTTVEANIATYYKNFLKYLMDNGSYAITSLSEIDKMTNISSSNYKSYASIEDVISKHEKMKALRSFAEYILTGSVEDINTDFDSTIEEPEYQSPDNEFQDLIDVDFDMENPHGLEDSWFEEQED